MSPIRCSCVFVALAVAAAAEPALLANGGFEEADPATAGRPLGWELPDGLGVQWVACPLPGAQGKAIRMDTAVSEQDMVAQWKKVGLTQWIFPNPAKDPIAATYGLSLYSQAVPVAPGVVYRVTARYHGSGGAKVWVRGYGEVHGEHRRLYESQGDCPAAEKDWGVFTQDFHPTKHTPKVTEMKVMLFAYWPAGVSWFDEVRIEALGQERP
jgi:hypothetical protein